MTSAYSSLRCVHSTVCVSAAHSSAVRVAASDGSIKTRIASRSRIAMSCFLLPALLDCETAVRELRADGSLVNFGWPIDDLRCGRVAADTVDAVERLQCAIDFADELVGTQRV